MKKVLIVDDEEIVRTSVSEILKGKGYQTFEADSGSSAVSLFHKKLPDAVLLDIKMPVMDGMETMREIRKINSCVPIIMLSAYGDIPTSVEAIKGGACDFICKPPDFEKIEAVLSAAIENRLNILDPMLSFKEIEVLRLMASGNSAKETADKLGIGLDTVNTYSKRIKYKLNAGNITHAVAKAASIGLIDLQ